MSYRIGRGYELQTSLNDDVESNDSRIQGGYEITAISGHYLCPLHGLEAERQIELLRDPLQAHYNFEWSLRSRDRQ